MEVWLVIRPGKVSRIFSIPEAVICLRKLD